MSASCTCSLRAKPNSTWVAICGVTVPTKVSLMLGGPEQGAGSTLSPFACTDPTRLVHAKLCGPRHGSESGHRSGGGAEAGWSMWTRA